MNNDISTDNNQLRWPGARLVTISLVIGCILFLLIDVLPPALANGLFSYNDIIAMALTTIAFGLFSLPFSIIGGYALGWFLQTTQWYKQSKTKVLLSGIIITVLTLLAVLTVGAVLASCLMFQVKCGEDFMVVIQAAIGGPSFIKALLIAAACGGITAWRLSLVAQQKTA